MYLHTKLWFYCFVDRLPWKELSVQFPERPAYLAVLTVLERRFLWCSAAGEIQETCLYKVHIMSSTYSDICLYMSSSLSKISANACPPQLSQRYLHICDSVLTLFKTFVYKYPHLAQVICLLHLNSLKSVIHVYNSTSSRFTFACIINVLNFFMYMYITYWDQTIWVST